MTIRRSKNHMPQPTLELTERVRRLVEENEATHREQIFELRQIVARQTKQLEALATSVKHLSNHEYGLRTALLEVQDRLLRRDDDIQATLYELRVALVRASSQHNAFDTEFSDRAENKGFVSTKTMGRQQLLLRRIREAVRCTLPRDATVLVVSEGDDGLLDLYGRQGWHFPQREGGEYAGRYPASDEEAIVRLEALRAKGGEYLLFPATSLWWLEQHRKLKQYLERHYRVMVSQADTCLIFGLHEPAASEDDSWWTKFEEVIAEFRLRFDRDPAILDWNTGLDLAAKFPQHNVFSPVAEGRVLPYLDQSIDVVVIQSSSLASLDEARRVASGVLVTFNREGNDNESDVNLDAVWKPVSTAVSATASIVIPTYNGIDHLHKCLIALQETLPNNFRGEVIVVDDASSTETRSRLRKWAQREKRLKIVQNRKNAGFIASCNRGAKTATGEILIFLNDDTLPQRDWLPPLLQIFDDYPDAGAVGGKLVYPDGRLQEAGGVIFSDGTGANFGRWDHNLDAPLYAYVREVDYCSGALLATRRDLFEELGGFDTYYQPAYYEDADYCFKVREKGYRVYYQPESTIIHLEGASSGTDLASGVKRYQVVNRAKFVERWGEMLQRRPAPPSRFDLETWHALAVCNDLEGAEG